MPNPFQEPDESAVEPDDLGLGEFSTPAPAGKRSVRKPPTRNWLAIGLGAGLHLGAVVLLGLYLMGTFTRHEQPPDSTPAKNTIVHENPGRTKTSGSTPSAKPLAAKPDNVVTVPSTAPAAEQPKSIAREPDPRAVANAGESILWMSEAEISGLRNVGFSGDSKLVITGGMDRTVRIWETTSGRQTYTFSGYASPGAGVGLSEDGSYFVSSGNEATQLGRVRIPADAMLRARPLEGNKETLVGAHGAKISCLAVSANGKNALTGSVDQTVRWWEVKLARELKVFKGHKAPVRAVDFSPKHPQCASVDDTGIVIIWELMTGRNLGRIEGLGIGVRSFDYSPDGRFILAADDTGLAVLEVPTLKLIRRMVIANDPKNFATSACWSPAGTSIIAGTDTGVLILDANSGAKQTSLDFPTAGTSGLAPITAITVSRDGRYVAAAGRSLWVWQLKTALTTAPESAESK